MKSHFTLVIILIIGMLFPQDSFSQAGTLDVSYGNNGTVILDPGSSHDSAWDMIILDDTSTIITGTMLEPSGTVSFLMRILPDGTQDMNFGTNGIITLQYGEDTYAREMILQSDGKIILAGLSYITASNGEYFIARFNPDFSPDLTFNSTGVFLTDYSPEEESCEAVTIQPDGKYILAGRTYLGSFSQLLFCRVNANGTLDTGFGTSGYTEINASPQDERINSVEVMSDGTIIGFGYGYQSTPYFGELVFMAKLTSSGAPAPGFGTNGVLIPPIFNDISVAYDHIIIDDSLFVTGYMYDASNNQQFFMAKLNPQGNAYNSFGTNGITFLLVEPVTIGFKVMMAGDGKLYVSGTTGLGGPSDRDFLLVRLDGAGALDASFNGSGYVTTDIQPAWDEANGMVMQPDGKIVLAGMSSGFPSNPNYIGMARYLNDYTPAGCYANFIANDNLVCEGNQVHFTDLTVSTDSVVVSWNWTFEGGTPASSTVQNPDVAYNTAGVYDVTLVVYDGIYTDSLTMEDFITVEAIPVAPPAPTGATELCGGYDSDYSTTSVTYADTYTWQVTPSSAGSITGNTTTANFVASTTWTGSATIQVRAVGMCGNGPWSTGFNVEIYHNPVQYQMVGNGEFCEGSAGAELTIDGSETGVNYELYFSGNPTGNIVAGDGSAISFGFHNTIGLYTVLGYNDNCSEFMIGQVFVHELPLPGQAYTPNGPAAVCDHDTSTYVTTQIDDADVYIWSFSPEEAGEMTVIFDTVMIAWTPGWTGKANLSVHAENLCGEGPESEVLEIDVYLDPAPEIAGPQLVCSGYEETYETTDNTGSFYTWEVEGGVITNGPGTAQITVLWGDPGAGSVTVTEETENGCTATTESFEVTIEECIYIGEESPDRMYLSPNPVKETLNINLNTKYLSNMTVSVYDLSGQKLDEFVIAGGYNQTNYQCDVSYLKPGLYLVKVINREGFLITGKFIKN